MSERGTFCFKSAIFTLLSALTVTNLIVQYKEYLFVHTMSSATEPVSVIDVQGDERWMSMVNYLCKIEEIVSFLFFR